MVMVQKQEIADQPYFNATLIALSHRAATTGMMLRDVSP